MSAYRGHVEDTEAVVGTPNELYCAGRDGTYYHALHAFTLVDKIRILSQVTTTFGLSWKLIYANLNFFREFLHLPRALSTILVVSIC